MENKVKIKMEKMDKSIKEMDSSYKYNVGPDFEALSESFNNYFTKYDALWDTINIFTLKQINTLPSRHFEEIEIMEKMLNNFIFKMNRLSEKWNNSIDSFEHLIVSFNTLEHLILVKPMPAKMIKTKYDGLNKLFQKEKKTFNLIEKKTEEYTIRLKMMHNQLNRIIANPHSKKRIKMLPFELN